MDRDKLGRFIQVPSEQNFQECPDCEGSGLSPYPDYAGDVCSLCAGSGLVRGSNLEALTIAEMTDLKCAAGFEGRAL